MDVAKLAALAERFRDSRVRSQASLHVDAGEQPDASRAQSGGYFDIADVIVVLEADVPWVPKHKAPRPDAKIIHIGADPIFENYPLRGFPCDLAISGVSARHCRR
jgi:acetolactate synthase-1/2/3 large subunit